MPTVARATTATITPATASRRRRRPTGRGALTGSPTKGSAGGATGEPAPESAGGPGRPDAAEEAKPGQPSLGPCASDDRCPDEAEGPASGSVGGSAGPASCGTVRSGSAPDRNGEPRRRSGGGGGSGGG